MNGSSPQFDEALRRIAAVHSKPVPYWMPVEPGVAASARRRLVGVAVALGAISVVGVVAAMGTLAYAQDTNTSMGAAPWLGVFAFVFVGLSALFVVMMANAVRSDVVDALVLGNGKALAFSTAGVAAMFSAAAVVAALVSFTAVWAIAAAIGLAAPAVAPTVVFVMARSALSPPAVVDAARNVPHTTRWTGRPTMSGEQR